MDKTNYLLDKVSQIESELQLQAQINQDTQEKIDTNDKNIGSLQDKTSTLDTKVATLQDDLSTCSTSIDKKVDKVDGKDLSTNDYDNKEKNNVANNTLSRHTHLNKTVLDDTTASFTTEEKTKLSNIENGANKNIQSDWSQTDTSADDYIKNKPTIPSNITLYSTTGQNTNGTMTQKAITDALSTKANCDASNLDDPNIESWANQCQFERTELFYDCSSSDSNLNWGKTSGIIGGAYENATKVNECLSKYRKLYFYIQADNNYITNQVFPLALDKTQKWGGYTAGYSFPGTYTYSTTKKYVRYTFRGTVSQSEQKFQFDFGSGDDLRNYNNNSNYFVRAIWGVFK